MVGVAHALGALHEDGLAHGGLAPGNVLLGADGPMVTDTGVSRSALTAPWPGDQTSDVFSLGCVAFFAATGRAPVPGCPANPEPAQADDPDLADCPTVLLPFVAECVAKDPERRPVAAVLARRLTVAAGQPPRSLLPLPIVARLEDHQSLPGSGAAAWARARWHRR
jgi:serine/threonine protein kinase